MEILDKNSSDFFYATVLAQPIDLTKESSVHEAGIHMRLTETINPIKLKNLLMSYFDKEWIEWSPETLVLEILNGKANDLLLDRISALQLCLRTDTPWLAWNIFEKVGRSFTFQDVDFLTFQPLSPGECSITIDILQQLREDEEFSLEVRLYVANIAFGDNIVYLPLELFPLKFNMALKNMIYLPDLAKNTSVAWDKIRDLELLDKEFNLEDPVQNQLSKLAVLKQFHKEYYEQ